MTDTYTLGMTDTYTLGMTSTHTSGMTDTYTLDGEYLNSKLNAVSTIFLSNINALIGFAN